MDKNLHDIEDLFRKALEKNEENPSQKAWDGIEKKLDKENVVSIKRKYDLLKKVAFLLLFLLAGLSIYVWLNQNKNSVKPNKDISSIVKGIEVKNDSLSKESGSILQKSADSLTFNKSKNPKWITKDSNKIINKTMVRSGNINPRKSVNLLSAEKISNKSVETVLSDKSIFSISKKSKLIKKKSEEVVQHKTLNQNEDKQLANKNPSDSQFGNYISAKEKLNLKDADYDKRNKTGLFELKEWLHNIALAKINPLTQIEKTIVRKPSLKSTNQPRFAISAFYSPDIHFFHDEDNNRRNSNRSDFEKSETENFSSTFGALMDYKIFNHWELQSGITLATSNFGLEPKTIYAQRDNSGGIQYKLSTPLGDAYVLPSFRNNPTIGDSIFSKSTTHTLQYLGIPLAVKYHFDKEKFTLNAFGGLSANFLIRGRITTELESANDSEFKTTDKMHGLKPFYLGGLAGIGLDYNFYKKLSVCFSPTFRFALNSINSNVPAASFPNSFSFGLGLKMEL
ncbi:MAG: outer membrane beta-barrel protein [Ginsengibacter sp.]